MSRETNPSVEPTVRDAHHALWHQRFARDLMRQFNELRKDPEAWEAYLAEAEDTHVADGIGEETRMSD